MSADRTPVTRPKDFAAEAMTALTRAGQRARERAAATHTAVAIWRNGKVEKLLPAGQPK